MGSPAFLRLSKLNALELWVRFIESNKITQIYSSASNQIL